MTNPTTTEVAQVATNGPCSPCGDGDTAQQYHQHASTDAAQRAAENTGLKDVSAGAAPPDGEQVVKWWEARRGVDIWHKDRKTLVSLIDHVIDAAKHCDARASEMFPKSSDFKIALDAAVDWRTRALRAETPTLLTPNPSGLEACPLETEARIAEIRETAEQVVAAWSAQFMGKVANEATYANLIERITAAFTPARASQDEASSIASEVDK